jgi:hypothetical protein
MADPKLVARANEVIDLKVGRASVSIACFWGGAGLGNLDEMEIATPRDGCWQTRSDAFA